MMRIVRLQSFYPFLFRALVSGQISRPVGISGQFAGSRRGIGDGAHGRRMIIEDADYEAAIDILNRYQTQSSARQSQKRTIQSRIATPRERTKEWLRIFGFDVHRYPVPEVIHVAGTKGKGTTCYYCNRILVEYQKKTGKPRKIGCLTSPHQLDVRERILINNEKISKPLFAYYIRILDAKMQSLSSQLDLKAPLIPGYPGFLSLLGIYIFISEKVDVAILETGMGGENDSTNIFPHPVVTGITKIGIDHVRVLGRTVGEIAWHKGGICKPGSIAATVPQDDIVLGVLQRRAEERHIAGELQVITDQKLLDYGVKVVPDLDYQRSNAALAIFLADTYLRTIDSHFVMTADIARSLHDVELLGRSQIVKDRDNIWYISSAVNEISLKQAVLWLKTLQKSEQIYTPKVLIFNQNFSKASPRDPYPLLQIIYKALPVDKVIFCSDQLDEVGKEKSDLIDFRTSRNAVSSLHNQRVNSEIWKELGGSGDITLVHTTRDAVHLIREKYKGADVFVMGSGYLAGNVLHILQSSD